MQIGIFSNGNRNNKVAKLSYDEDLKEIIVADRLGMTEAWISEHGAFLAWQAPDELPCVDLMICKAADSPASASAWGRASGLCRSSIRCSLRSTRRSVTT
jgi:hypothetical protein